MTFPLKENFIHFEILERRQRRIYADACDFGVQITDEERLEAREKLMELMEFFGYKMERWGDRVSGRSYGSTTRIFMPVERDGNAFGGMALEVTFTYDAGRKIQFLSIKSYHSTLLPATARSRFNCKQAA